LPVPGDAEERWYVAAVCVLLFVAGVGAGAVGAFLTPLRLFSGLEGLSVVIAVVGNVGLGALGGVGTRSVWGAIAPALGWAIAVLVLTSYSRGGDVVIAGGLPVDPGVVQVGTWFMVGGLLSAGAGVAFTLHRLRLTGVPQAAAHDVARTRPTPEG
jgi:hypothetical protein